MNRASRAVASLGVGSSGLVAISLLVLAYAAVSRRLSGSVISAAMVFVAGGILVSDEALGWLDPAIESESVRLVAEATLTLVLFSDASRIDLAALRREYALPLRLLAIGLPLTIVAGALAGVAVLAELAFIEAVLLAIVLAPTDAALGQAVVTDPRVPSRVRQGLNVESGLNDGICVPLLLIAIAIAEAQEGAIGDGEAVELVLEEIGYGALGSVIAGLAAAAVVRVGVPRRLVDEIWVQVVPVAGAALAYGLAVWMGGSGFIAAFVGGAVFGGLRREVGGEVTLFLEETGGLLGAVTFVLFGAAMLVPVLDDLTAEVVLYGLLSLTLVRMVPVALAMLRLRRQAADGRISRLVRAARARLDRLRGDPGRGCPPGARARLAEHDLLHHRAVGAPARRDGNAARGALRAVVCGPPSRCRAGFRKRVDARAAAPPVGSRAMAKAPGRLGREAQAYSPLSRVMNAPMIQNKGKKNPKKNIHPCPFLSVARPRVQSTSKYRKTPPIPTNHHIASSFSISPLTADRRPRLAPVHHLTVRVTRVKPTNG